MKNKIIFSLFAFIFLGSYVEAKENNQYPNPSIQTTKQQFSEFDQAIRINRDKLLRDNGTRLNGSNLTGVGNIIVDESATTGHISNNTEIKNSTIIITK